MEFGFDVCYGDSLELPKGFAMTFSEIIIDKDNYRFENVVTNSWDSGYTGELRITNIGDKQIEDWKITIQSADVISNVWNGTVTDLGNGMYEIKGPEHYQNVKPQETVAIGYQARGNQTDSVELVLFCASAEEQAGNIEDKDPVEGGGAAGEENPSEEETFEGSYIEIYTAFQETSMENVYEAEDVIENYNGKLNNWKNVKEVKYEIVDAFNNVVQSGNLLYDENDGAWTIEDFGLVIGWNDVIFSIYLVDGTVVEEVYSYTNSIYENMEKVSVDLQDNDEDGINNYYESIYGTDKDKADTDGDTLSDFEELMAIGTDATLYDTDGNGICDADEDFDEDGLTAIEELSYGTNTMAEDSDLDEISDYDEIFEIGTDPVMEDTDEDGLSDGLEWKLGTNPLLADTDGDGTIDGEEKIEQQVTLEMEGEDCAVSAVSVELACSGDMENQVFIENTLEKDPLSAGVVGLIGAPIDIQSMTSFEEAVITFHYDKELLGETKEEDLCILWYDEANMTYVMLEDSVIDLENQTVSYTTDHFSTYLLVDKKIWLDAWRVNMNYDEQTPVPEDATYDICICLDYSTSAEELAKQKAFAKRIIEQMVDGDRIKMAVYRSSGRGYYHTTWASNKTSAIYRVNNIENDIYEQYNDEVKPTGTYSAEPYGAINLITSMVDKNTTNRQVAFLLNSGKNEDNQGVLVKYSKTQAEEDLQSLGFPVHSVSVTMDTNEELEGVLKEYGGKSFILTTLEEIVRKDYPSANLGMLDTDGDGLYDAYEINGMRIQNGTTVYTNPYLQDTDGDGLSDYQEIGALMETLVNGGDEYVATINYQKSDPNNPQSTGRKLDENYMVVDNFYYLPYKAEVYDMIFVDDTRDKDADGNMIYGQYHIYGADPLAFSDIDSQNTEEIKRIKSNVQIICSMLKVASKVEWLPEAKEFLLKYINNDSERNFYHCGNILKGNEEVRDAWAHDVFHLMDAVHGYLTVGETLIITQVPDDQKTQGVSLSIWDKISVGVLNGHLAINNAATRTIAKVTFDGDEYTMDVRFYILDYYNWDKDDKYEVGGIVPSELYQLCKCGASRFYENWGFYDTQIKWKATDDGNARNKILEEEKVRLEEGAIDGNIMMPNLGE